jgi:hypothetical protein
VAAEQSHVGACAVTPAEREALLDEIGKCYARAAVDALLAEPQVLNKNAAEQKQRRREGAVRDTTPARPPDAT